MQDVNFSNVQSYSVSKLIPKLNNNCFTVQIEDASNVYMNKHRNTHTHWQLVTLTQTRTFSWQLIIRWRTSVCVQSRLPPPTTHTRTQTCAPILSQSCTQVNTTQVSWDGVNNVSIITVALGVVSLCCWFICSLSPSRTFDFPSGFSLCFCFVFCSLDIALPQSSNEREINFTQNPRLALHFYERTFPKLAAQTFCIFKVIFKRLVVLNANKETVQVLPRQECCRSRWLPPLQTTCFLFPVPYYGLSSRLLSPVRGQICRKRLVKDVFISGSGCLLHFFEEKNKRITGITHKRLNSVQINGRHGFPSDPDAL